MKSIMKASVVFLVMTLFGSTNVYSQSVNVLKQIKKFNQLNEKAIEQNKQSPILVKKIDIVESKIYTMDEYKSMTLREKFQFLPSLQKFMMGYVPYEKDNLDEMALNISFFLKYVEMIYKDVNRLGDYNAYGIEKSKFMEIYQGMVESGCWMFALGKGYSEENRVLMGDTVMMMIPTVKDDLTKEWINTMKGMMIEGLKTETNEKIKVLEKSIVSMLNIL